MHASYLFSADQYVHLYNTCLLDGQLQHPSIREWLQLNTFPVPNWSGHALTLAFTQILPLALAEKLLVIVLWGLNGYAFLGAFYGQAASDKSRRWFSTEVVFASLALMFWFSASWQLGFVNYLLGMAGVLAALRHTSHYRGRGWKVLVWACLLYFCHPIALLFFGGTYMLRYFLQLAHSVSHAREVLRRKVTWQHFLLAFGLPGVLLIAYIITYSEVSTLAGASPWRLLGLAYYHHDLTLYSAQEEVLAKAIMLATVVAIAYGAYRLRKHNKKRWLLGTIGLSVLIGAIIFAPNYFAGGALIHQRLMPITFIWSFWILYPVLSEALQRFVTARRVYAFIALVLIAGISSVRLISLQDTTDALDELVGFSLQIPAGSTVLPVAASGQFSFPNGRLSPKPVMHHFGAVIPCHRQLVLLDNYEAFVGYFPLQWRPDRDPYQALGRGLEEHPAKLEKNGADWLFERCDYVLSYGALQAAVVPETYTWLAPRLKHVGTSPSGSYQLFQVR